MNRQVLTSENLLLGKTLLSFRSGASPFGLWSTAHRNQIE